MSVALGVSSLCLAEPLKTMCAAIDIRSGKLRGSAFGAPIEW